MTSPVVRSHNRTIPLSPPVNSNGSPTSFSFPFPSSSTPEDDADDDDVPLTRPTDSSVSNTGIVFLNTPLSKSHTFTTRSLPPDTSNFPLCVTSNPRMTET